MDNRKLLDEPLDEAIASVTARVKAKPGDAAQRLVLAELLCLAGNIERADLQLDTASKVDSSLAIWVAAFRQVLRGELSRREVFDQGRLPEFVVQPGAGETASLQALLALREGRGAAAAALLAEAEERRLPISGICGGQPFDDFRDLNDLTAGFFEVLTGSGVYYWVPFAQVETMEFLPPQRIRDLVWRRVRLSCRQGPEGEVFMPSLYVGSHAHGDGDIRVGRRTDWEETAEGLVRGVGQRSFLVADDDLPVMELSTVTFSDGA